MGDQKNLLLAIVASLAILLGFQFLFPSEEINLNKQGEENTDSIIPIPENSKIDISSREDIISESSRINIGNDLIEGTLALTGGRIDDILLKNYFETLEDDSHNEIDEMDAQEQEEIAAMTPKDEGGFKPRREVI